MAGSWSNTAQQFLVIPTGATTGERIEINVGNSGLINIYNAAGTLVDSIGGPTGDITSFNPANSNKITLRDGQILFGPNSTAFVQGDDGNLILDSGQVGTLTSHAEALLFAGLPSTGTGQANTPTLQLLAGGGSAMDLSLSGSVYVTGATWQAPAYKANWSGANSFNGLGGMNPLRAHLTAENEVRLYGPTVAAAGAGTTVATLPAGYFDSTHTLPGVVEVCSSTNVLSRMPVAIDTGGNALLAAASATGSTYLFDLCLPLGKLP